MRYVGDMLAWVHQAIAAEQEFLESLFNLKVIQRMVGSVRKFGTGGEEEEWIQELLDLAVGKLCVPLKVMSSSLSVLTPFTDQKNYFADEGTADCEVPGE